MAVAFTCRWARPRNCASRSSSWRWTAPFAEPLPTDAASFAKRIEEGRGRLTLIANEIARAAGTVLAEWSAAQRKLKDSKPAKDTAEDVAAQLARLVGKRFLVTTPWARWRICRAT